MKLLIGILALSGALAHADDKCAWLGKQWVYESSSRGCRKCDAGNSIQDWGLKVVRLNVVPSSNDKKNCLKIQNRMRKLETMGCTHTSEYSVIDEAEMEICGN